MRCPVPAGLGLLALALAGPALARDDGDAEWRHRAGDGAVTVMANPLGRTARIAFYEARGFPADALRPYADACGFSIVMTNGGNAPLVTRLADWRAVGADDRTVTFATPEDWEARWRAAEVPAAAGIAFRWAQFQSENAFAPGDWIMGMVTLAARPAAPFAIVVAYRDGKGLHEIALASVRCADD